MVLLATVVGALFGVFTGLIPGIHVNTVVALLLAGSAGFASLGVEFSALLAFTCALGLPRFRGQVNAFGHLMTFVSTVVGVGAVGHARSAWSKGLVGARRASTGPAASTPGAAA